MQFTHIDRSIVYFVRSMDLVQSHSLRIYRSTDCIRLVPPVGMSTGRQQQLWLSVDSGTKSLVVPLSWAYSLLANIRSVSGSQICQYHWNFFKNNEFDIIILQIRFLKSQWKIAPVSCWCSRPLVSTGFLKMDTFQRIISLTSVERVSMSTISFVWTSRLILVWLWVQISSYICISNGDTVTQANITRSEHTRCRMLPQAIDAKSKY